MITYDKKFYFFKVKETWFHPSNSMLDLFRLRLYSHVKPDGQQPVGVKNVSHTVELSLEPAEEEIIANFRNTVKQEIRKSEKEGVVCTFEKDVETFIPFYNEFARAKNIYPTTGKMFERIGDNITLSFAKLNGEILAAHSYLIDRELGVARLFHSASRRLDETYDRNIVGRANKLLTARDISHFKSEGFKLMDFGGYTENTEDKSMKGINEFKLSFGGTKVECVNYQSFPYFILQRIAARFDKRY